MGVNRVIRGGSWNNSAENCRSSYRNRNEPSNRNDNLGFRVARSSADEVDALPDGTGRFPVRLARTKLNPRPSRAGSQWRTLGTAVFVGE